MTDHDVPRVIDGPQRDKLLGDLSQSLKIWEASERSAEWMAENALAMIEINIAVLFESQRGANTRQ